jgi:hypothetical protein
MGTYIIDLEMHSSSSKFSLCIYSKQLLLETTRSVQQYHEDLQLHFCSCGIAAAAQAMARRYFMAAVQQVAMFCHTNTAW